MRNSLIEPPLDQFEDLINLQESKKNPLQFNAQQLCKIFKELQRSNYFLTSFIEQRVLASVFEAKNQQNQVFAIQCIPNSQMLDINRELKVINRIGDIPQTVKFIKNFYSETCNTYFYVTERLSCNFQFLLKSLYDQNQTLPLNSIIAFATQIATCLQALEQKNIIHSDINPSNIFYDESLKQVKLGNYDVSLIVESEFTNQIIGFTYRYCPPEIIQQLNEYSIKGDIFSLGLILLEITIGRFLESQECALIRNGNSNIFNQDEIYMNLNEIIRQMLIVDIRQRISPTQLLENLRELKIIEELKFMNFNQKYIQIPELLKNIQQSFQRSLLEIHSQAKQVSYNFI